MHEEEVRQVSPLQAWQTTPEPRTCVATPSARCFAAPVATPAPPTGPPPGIVGPNDYYQYLKTKYPALVSLLYFSKNS
jgi:hypothetical protein